MGSGSKAPARSRLRRCGHTLLVAPNVGRLIESVDALIDSLEKSGDNVVLAYARRLDADDAHLVTGGVVQSIDPLAVEDVFSSTTSSTSGPTPSERAGRAGRARRMPHVDRASLSCIPGDVGAVYRRNPHGRARLASVWPGVVERVRKEEAWTTRDMGMRLYALRCLLFAASRRPDAFGLVELTAMVAFVERRERHFARARMTNDAYDVAVLREVKGWLTGLRIDGEMDGTKVDGMHAIVDPKTGHGLEWRRVKQDGEGKGRSSSNKTKKKDKKTKQDP